MYIESAELKAEISEIGRAALAATDGAAVLEEYVYLPYYGGHIMLRFDFRGNAPTWEMLDHYEGILYDLVDDRFLVDFMGSVYHGMGCDYAQLDALFLRFAKTYVHEIIPISPHQARMIQDVQALLLQCGLPADAKVWEIQWEDEISIFLLGTAQKHLQTLHADRTYHIFETNEICCEGLMKATLYAKRNRISLGRLLS